MLAGALRYPHKLMACLLVAASLLHPLAGAASDVTAAELVFVNGNIYTVDSTRRWAQAIAVKDGRITYVGTDAGARERVGHQTRLVDLQGKMMLPGMQDAHVHPISSGMDALACDLSGEDSLAGYLKVIKAYAQNNPDKPWITGGGWTMDVFGPGARASRKLLDEIVPDRPVYLTSTDGHSAWVNSKALELAGITAATPNPEDGIIDRERGSKEPVGSLQEGATALVSELLPEPDLATRSAGLQYAMEMLNSYGITSIQDAIVHPPELATYHELDQRGGLNLRVVAALWWQRKQGIEQISQFKAQRDQFSEGRLRATTVKIMQDGVLENFTAAMLEPYIDQGGTRGIPMIAPAALKDIVTELDAAGFQVHFHAIGDAAIRQSLDAVEAARKRNGIQDNRHHISHLEVIDPADVPRFRELDVIANFQPLWAFADSYITDLTIPFIGPQRATELYPINSLHRDGAVIAFGSDWSVSTANPFYQMEVAVTRQGPEGETSTPMQPGERIGLPEAIAAFTINGAYANHSEQDTGSIEVGKFADLVVLDRNLFAIDASEISKTSALLTVLEGKVVHGSLEALQAGSGKGS